MSDSDQTKPNLLIADRDGSERIRLGSIFVGMWTVSLCETSENAVELCRLQKFDVVLLDVDSMDEDAIPNLSKIRNDEGLSNNAVIVAMLSFSPGDFENYTINAGADLCLKRPVSALDVERKVTLATANRHLIRLDSGPRAKEI